MQVAREASDAVRDRRLQEAAGDVAYWQNIAVTLNRKAILLEDQLTMVQGQLQVSVGIEPGEWAAHAPRPSESASHDHLSLPVAKLNLDSSSMVSATARVKCWHLWGFALCADAVLGVLGDP